MKQCGSNEEKGGVSNQGTFINDKALFAFARMTAEKLRRDF